MKKSFKQIKADWEVKPRIYELVGNKRPPLRQIRSRHSATNHLLFFDEDAKEQKELRYVAGSKSPFAEDQPERSLVGHIFFKDGLLRTRSTDIALQQFLEITPDNGRIFYEIKPEQNAEAEVGSYEDRGKAYEIIGALSVTEIAAFMYSQISSEVFNTSTKELKRDLYVLADNDANTIIALSKSESTGLKYLAAEAIKFNVVKVEGGSVKWTKNGRKIMTIPVDETPVTALAHFFLTDDGVEVKSKVQELVDKV